NSLPTEADARQGPAIAMLALHVRQGDLSAAQPFWLMLATVGQATPEMVQPTAMYSVALLKSGRVEEALVEARNMFARIRSASPQNQLRAREQVNEALDLIGRVLMQTTAVIPP